MLYDAEQAVVNCDVRVVSDAGVVDRKIFMGLTFRNIS